MLEEKKKEIIEAIQEVKSHTKLALIKHIIDNKPTMYNTYRNMY